MKYLLAILLFALPMAAQDVVVNVPITVDAGFRDAVVAWVDAQCSATDDSGACTAQPYTNAVDLVQQAAQREVDRVVRAIIAWAAATDPSLLPQAMRDAITARDTAVIALATLEDGAVQ